MSDTAQPGEAMLAKTRKAAIKSLNGVFDKRGANPTVHESFVDAFTAESDEKCFAQLRRNATRRGALRAQGFNQDEIWDEPMISVVRSKHRESRD